MYCVGSVLIARILFQKRDTAPYYTYSIRSMFEIMDAIYTAVITVIENDLTHVRIKNKYIKSSSAVSPY